MNKIINVRNIKQALSLGKANATIKVYGRIESFHKLKSKLFLHLSDGSTLQSLQVVSKHDLLAKPRIGSYVEIKGKISESLGAKQATEILAENIDVIGDCDTSEFPFSLKKLEENSTYRKHAHFRPRIKKFASLLRVRSELELAIHQIMRQMDFFKVHTPTLTSNDSESNSDLFKVIRTTNDESSRQSKADYFDKDVYLVVSAQLHLEVLASSLSRVYTINNTFRAENSITRRHLCEFTMFEAEEANVLRTERLMDRVETIIKFACYYLRDISYHKDDFLSLVDSTDNVSNLEKLSESTYIRITYDAAIDILNKNINQINESLTTPIDKLCYGCDINRTCERVLLNHFNNVPVFIVGYPASLKPFYMKTIKRSYSNHDRDRSLNQNMVEQAECFDLIAPFGGEICGGSLREDSYEKLSKKIASIKAGENFEWYLDTRKYGTFPHGGFGIGIDRLLQAMLGVSNIRDVNIFPRYANYCPL